MNLSKALDPIRIDMLSCLSMKGLPFLSLLGRGRKVGVVTPPAQPDAGASRADSYYPLKRKVKIPDNLPQLLAEAQKTVVRG